MFLPHRHNRNIDLHIVKRINLCETYETMLLCDALSLSKCGKILNQ